MADSQDTPPGPVEPGPAAPPPAVLDEAAVPARPQAPLVHLRVRPTAGAPLPLEEAFPGLTALGPVGNERKARDWALVLQSMSVWHAIRRSAVGWVLLVNDTDYRAASAAIDGYEAENRDWPPRPTRERARHSASLVIPAIFAALVAFFVVTGPSARNSFWFVHGVAVSSEVVSSAPWTAVTALTLHADSLHVLGNAISGTIFASAVQRRLGSGGAALTVLASGILGNVANAFFHARWLGVEHGSLGASTAVFGAIGLLAATELVLHRRDASRKRTWTEIAAPVVGGFALLGALGSGGGSYEPFGDAVARPITTDLGAHLFGLLAGLVIGLVVALPLRRSSFGVDVGSGQHGQTVTLGAGAPRWWLQTTLGGVAAAVVLGAWQLALRR